MTVLFQEHVIYQWNDKSEELHSRFAQLLREKVQTYMSEYLQSLPEGTSNTCHIFTYNPLLHKLFLCPQRNFGRHIVIALSVRPSVRPSIRPSCFCVRSISPIFFEVGIPNLVSGYILGWRSVAYYFRVTVTLTSDLVFRIFVSGADLLYYCR